DLEPAGVDAGRALAHGVPADIDPAFWRFGKAFERGAVDGVDGDTLAGGDDADDAVARQRMAAAREMHRHAGNEPADGDLACTCTLLVAAGAGLGCLVAGARDRHDVGAAGLARLPEPGIDGSQHLARADQAGANGGDQVVAAGLPEGGAHAVERLVSDLVARLVDGLVEERAAEVDVLLALARAHEAADRGLGLAGDDEAFPGRRRR